MTETLEKQFISNFSSAWNETVPALLDQPSTLALLALREVAGEEVGGALAVAATWSSAFVVPCAEGLSGVFISLFKAEDETELDRLTKQPTDGLPKPGVRALLAATLAETVKQLAEQQPLNFAETAFFDLTADESRLAEIVGDAVSVGTFSLTIGDDINTQALLLYAPHGSLEKLNATPPPGSGVAEHAADATSGAAATTPNASGAQAAAAASQTPSSRRNGTRREETRNLDRLLDVELNVVVRFGITSVPLREVVRMGVGSMIELNRAVDEPVELLVNGRSLARGEVVVVDGYYGVRITEIGAPADRALSLV